MPLVSVVLATYNRKKYVTRAIGSVFLQTYKNIEIIVVDDCSKDGTSELVLKLAAQDARIRLLRNETNLGFPASLNKGIQISNGKYIARLDDDDLWSNSKKLEKQVNFLEAHPDYALVGGGAILIGQQGNEISKILLPEEDQKIRGKILSDNCFVHSTVLFTKKAWQDAKGYDADFGTDCDWGLWLEIGKSAKLYNFPEYFANYLKWPENISGYVPKSGLKTRIRLANKYKKYYPGYLRAILLGCVYYLYFLVSRGKGFGFMPKKIRALFFGKPPYKKT